MALEFDRIGKLKITHKLHNILTECDL
ncbi:MAG: hypothetical protein ACI91R_001816, partial [Vicingaceae bacterium]